VTDFSGIDPDAMRGMIGSFDKDAKALGVGARSIKSRFSRYGIDTADLTELLNISRWADDQLPMLRRRQSLAAALQHPEQGPHLQMVRLPEPIPLTAQQAQAQGRNLADDANKAEKLDADAAGAELHRIAGQLAAHKDDPDWVTAFYAALDPKLAAHLPSVVAATHSATGKDDMTVFAQAFRTALNAADPASGFDKVKALFQGPLPKDDPTAVWNRALMQQDDKDFWDVAWDDIKDLFVPKHNWSSEGGILQGVLAGQAAYAGIFREKAEKFSEKAAELYRQRIDGANLTPAERAQLKRLTSKNAKLSAAEARQAEAVLNRLHLGWLYKFMNLSVTDAVRPLVSGAAADGKVLGSFLRVGEKVPVVGALLTVGGTAYDIENGTDADVAVTANVGSFALGAGAGWAAEAGAVALAGGPVGWGVAAGVVVAAGVGYAAYRFLESDTGQAMIKGTEHAIGSAAKTVGHWLGF
jgi:hypothetical protein